MSNNQLPTDVQERIKADAEAATGKEEVRLKDLNQEYGRMVSQLHGHEAGYIAGATAYATKWFTCFEENGKMAEVIAAYATKLHEAQQENEKLKAIANLWRPLMEEVVKRFEGVAEMADQDYDLNLTKQIKRFLYGE